MKTLVLSDDSKTLNIIFRTFEAYSIKVELSSVSHIEDIPPDASGMIIPNLLDSNYANLFLQYAKKNKLKTLAVGRGLVSLLNFSNKLDCNVEEFSGGDSTFLALGSKFAEIIGGAGPLNTHYSLNWEIPIRHLPNKFLLSGVNLGNGCIEAVEMERNLEIIGIIWPIFSSQKIPSRFENILSWISE